MATGRRRDEAAIAAGFTRWLQSDGGRPDVRAVMVTRPGAGHSNETFLVQGDSGAAADRWVLRLPPLVPLVPDYDVGREAAVLDALAAAGLPVPGPVVHERDPRHLDVEFLVMPMVDGHVVGEVAVLDPWLADSPPDAQARVQGAFVALLARAHRLDPAATGLDRVLRRAPVTADLDWWDEYLRWAFGDAPIATLTDVLGELRATAPADVPPAIRWGDARLGNVVYAEDRTLRAALDWELATVGAPEADLAWYLALDDVVASFIDRRLPGFADRDGVIAAYEEALGRPVEHLAWHELFALLRSAAINARIARIAAEAGGSSGAGGEDDPVVGYLRRRLATVRSRS